MLLCGGAVRRRVSVAAVLLFALVFSACGVTSNPTNTPTPPPTAGDLFRWLYEATSGLKKMHADTTMSMSIGGETMEMDMGMTLAERRMRMEMRGEAPGEGPISMTMVIIEPYLYVKATGMDMPDDGVFYRVSEEESPFGNTFSQMFDAMEDPTSTLGLSAFGGLTQDEMIDLLDRTTDAVYIGTDTVNGFTADRWEIAIDYAAYFSEMADSSSDLGLSKDDAEALVSSLASRS
jgi:hypothetical protein